MSTGRKEAEAAQGPHRNGQVLTRDPSRERRQITGKDQGQCRIQGIFQEGAQRLAFSGGVCSTVAAQVRATGESPSTDDIVRVAKLFDDDLTLENLSRPQLVSMCRYMNIRAFGTDNFLRQTIRNRLAEIRRDDKVRRRATFSALLIDCFREDRSSKTKASKHYKIRNWLLPANLAASAPLAFLPTSYENT
jgi:hypothetical protein